jgi:hypothetical protein
LRATPSPPHTFQHNTADSLVVFYFVVGLGLKNLLVIATTQAINSSPKTVRLGKAEILMSQVPRSNRTVAAILTPRIANGNVSPHVAQS